MQISRHWRLNSQRYRLQGVRYETGEMSLQNRPAPTNTKEEIVKAETTDTSKKLLKAAS